jgi:hypothetical protein
MSTPCAVPERDALAELAPFRDLCYGGIRKRLIIGGSWGTPFGSSVVDDLSYGTFNITIRLVRFAPPP